ncbi:MAG TPA: VacB/RNase II family 3'-5' exoribonuclease, partial [Kiloniellales bacterium]|nr:VacB/RNase II family 3'-5' exoribonuclease [Kiloniellales bacterium]
MTRSPRSGRKGGGKTEAPLPTREELLEYLRRSETPLGKRELARAFQLKGDQRIRLKEMLAALKDEGLLGQQRGRRLAAQGRLPSVAVVEVVGLDEDGELLARPVGARPSHEDEDEERIGPRIFLAPDRRGRRPVAGDRVLARLRHVEDDRYEGFVIRHLGKPERRLVGVFERQRRGGVVRPASRQLKESYRIAPEDSGGAQDGELVLAEPKEHHPRAGVEREARVIDRLGDAANPKALSLISIAEHGLPDIFPAVALAEAEAARAVGLGNRLDLRSLPLVTIDGEDARDFDDAVFAEADPDPANPGGFRLVVAIADVAHYVAPESALDREARKRGNSAYFPDRVIPMLPEALSNGWCSLRPGEDRPVLAAELWIDADGRLKRHRFHRALMRSAARLIYEHVQEAFDGRPNQRTAPLLQPAIRPLYAAFAALERARKARGTLDLDLPERRVILASDGSVEAIKPRERLDSHRLIEAFMITANVAAAEALEAKRAPCMYRVHEPPDPVKVEALRDVLEGLDLSFPRGQALKPALFARVLEQIRGQDAAQMVSDLILRAQSQARYAPENLGHFGLALTRYAHFTSPIRRYADLLVHRSLIGAYRLGEGALPAEQAAKLPAWGEAISATERRA